MSWLDWSWSVYAQNQDALVYTSNQDSSTENEGSFECKMMISQAKLATAKRAKAGGGFKDDDLKMMAFY